MTIGLQFLGRFGNCLFQYSFARAYAEKHGLQLQTDPWIGQKIFDLNDPPISPLLQDKRDENTLVDGEHNFILRSYCQQQKCLIYTQEQAKRWFKFRPVIDSELKSRVPREGNLVGHRRVGDYAGYGYPVVSLQSYINHCENVLGIPERELVMVTEESAYTLTDFPTDLAFLPDFYRLCRAHILLRGNSTFSWWAAVLGNSIVYSPLIHGKPGGIEHDCQFTYGHWPRLANLEFTTDLVLRIQ